jgi:hypothetical protein
MAALAKWTGVAALAALTLLGLAPRRAEAVINPLFQVPFGVNPYFRVRPGLTLSQAYYNVAAMGQAYAQVPPYALGYNPYIPVYAPPVPAAYTPTYTYPPGTFMGYGNTYVPVGSGYVPPRPGNPYIPQGSAANPAPARKGVDRLAGLTNAEGKLAWPLGLTVLPPAAETDPLRNKISNEVFATLDRAEDGKASRTSVQQVTRDINHLEALLNERASDVPLTDQAVADARRFLHSLKDRITRLPTHNE